jgi:hypothetical protein
VLLLEGRITIGLFSGCNLVTLALTLSPENAENICFGEEDNLLSWALVSPNPPTSISIGFGAAHYDDKICP